MGWHHQLVYTLKQKTLGKITDLFYPQASNFRPPRQLPEEWNHQVENPCSSMAAPPGGPSIQVLSCDSNFIIGDLEFEVLGTRRVFGPGKAPENRLDVKKHGGQYVLKTHIYWFYCDIQAFVIEYDYLTISYTTSCGSFAGVCSWA